MLIRFSCPHCSRAFREEAGMAGTRVRCAGCNTVFEVVPELSMRDVPDSHDEATGFSDKPLPKTIGAGPKVRQSTAGRAGRLSPPPAR